MNRLKGILTNPFIVFPIVALILVSIWFRPGFFYGGGDVGLTIYNPKRIAEVISKAWWQETAPGFPRPQGLASLPLELALSVLQDLGLPFFMIQAVLFAALISSMGIGMHLLAREVFEGEDKKEKMALLAGFFYVVNPYMMVQVWHRFIHSTFFLVAGIPFIFLFWKRWIEGKGHSNLIFFLLSNLIFCFAFSTLAYIITLWGLLTLFIFCNVFAPWKGVRHFLTTMFKFLVAFFLWILTNIWWLAPIILVTPSVVSNQHSILSSVSTLISISYQSIIPYSIAGLNAFYLFYEHELGTVFSNPLFLFIPYLAVFFVFVGIYQSLRKKRLVFWPILFIVALFFAKGISAPFGYPFLHGFTQSFIIGVFRNPFEKIGVLLPFASSILFAMGFFRIYLKVKGTSTTLSLTLVLLTFGLFFGIYHWPFWSGRLFGNIYEPGYVRVPDYYQEANEWIKNKGLTGNILHMPMVIKEGLNYKWEYGYQGVDSTTDFFTSNPSISMGFNLYFLDNALRALELSDEMPMAEEERIKSLFKAFNIRFVVMHYDINWQNTGIKNSKKVGKFLDRLSFLTKQAEFGQLVVYEIDSDQYVDKIYTQSNYDILFGLNYEVPNFAPYYAWYFKHNPNNLSVSNLTGDSFIKDGEEIILPSRTFNFYPMEKLSADEALRYLPAVRFLPDSPLYYFIKLKEWLLMIGTQNSLENPMLNYSGKRLVEAYKLLEQDPQAPISVPINDYKVLIVSTFDKLGKVIKATTVSKEVSSEVKRILDNHVRVLENLRGRASLIDKPLVDEALNILKHNMIELGVFTEYEIILTNESTGERVQKFHTSRDGEYELLMTDPQTTSIYQGELKTLNFQINGNKRLMTAKKMNNYVSYGNLFLSKGDYEISYPVFNSINLFKGFADNKEELEISSNQHTPAHFETRIEPYFPRSTYVLSFDFFVIRGNGPKVRVMQDSDPVDTGKMINSGDWRSYQYEVQTSIDNYNKYWRRFFYPIDTRHNSSEFKIQIIASPWNDCAEIYPDKASCDNRKISFNYERPSTFLIKNLKVQRVLDNNLFLRSKTEGGSSATPANVTYTKTGPLIYEGEFEQGESGFLVLTETFDKGWVLTLDNGIEAMKAQNHVLANMYANAWFVDSGKYKFKLEYKPQVYFNIGVLVSGLVFVLLCLVYLVYKIIRRKV